MKEEKELINYVKRRYSKQMQSILEDFANYLQSNYTITLQYGVWRNIETGECKNKMEIVFEYTTKDLSK